jgi:hypothetical protein
MELNIDMQNSTDETQINYVKTRQFKSDSLWFYSYDILEKAKL